MDFRRNLEQLRDAISRRQHHELVILSVLPPPSSRVTTTRMPRLVLTLNASGC